MNWAHCDVVSIINGNEVRFGEISVCVMPRIGEKMQIKGKKIKLPDGKLVSEQVWVVTDVCHDLSYPYEKAERTNEQTIKIYVESFTGRQDD